jgi:WD40 repeat protein
MGAEKTTTNTLAIYEASTFKKVATFGKFSTYATTFAFAPDGKTLATTTGGYKVPARIWKVGSWEVLHEVVGTPKGSARVVYSPDGKTLATLDMDSHVRLWDVATGKLKATLLHLGPFLAHVAFSPDGTTLAVGDAKGDVDLWDLKTLKVRSTIQTCVSNLFFLAYQPDGRAILTAGPLGSLVRFWDPNTGELRRVLDLSRAKYSKLEAVALSADTRLLLSAGGKLSVHLWDVATGRLAAQLEHGVGLDSISVALAPDGSLALAIVTMKHVVAWKLPRSQ